MGSYSGAIAEDVESLQRYLGIVEVFKGRDKGKRYGVYKLKEAAVEYVDIMNQLIYYNGIYLPNSYIKFNTSMSDEKRTEMMIHDLSVLEWPDDISKMIKPTDSKEKRRLRKSPIIPRDKNDKSHCDIYNALGCLLYFSREKGKVVKNN